MCLLPILKEKMNNRAMVQQVRTIWIQFIPQLHLPQCLNQGLRQFTLILLSGLVSFENDGHGDIDVGFYFLRID